MASWSIFKRPNSNNRKSLFATGSGKFNETFSLEEAFIQSKIETLSVSERLVKTFSKKFKKKKKTKRNDLGGFLIEKRAMERPSSSSNCLSLYIKGGGCSRVGSCDEIYLSGMRKSSISEDCLPLKGIEKKSSRKMKGLELPEISLPDDVLEMILVRLPLRTLIAARVVCKKWSRMITWPQFVQLWSEMCHKNPWLFVFC